MHAANSDFRGGQPCRIAVFISSTMEPASVSACIWDCVASEISRYCAILMTSPDIYFSFTLQRFRGCPFCLRGHSVSPAQCVGPSTISAPFFWRWYPGQTSLNRILFSLLGALIKLLLNMLTRDMWSVWTLTCWRRPTARFRLSTANTMLRRE